MTADLQVQLPSGLLNDAKRFVEEGGAPGLNELLVESLRRYLASHDADLIESFIREDVAWGLDGKN